MSSIGPQLPPHLTKRKRTPEDDENDAPSKSPGAKTARTARPQLPNEAEIDLEDSESDSGYGPKAPSGPQLPTKNTEEIDLESDSDSDVGPAPPPQPASAGPSLAAPQPSIPQEEDSESDSEDDYGPAPPNSSKAVKPVLGPAMPPTADDDDTPQRDNWMLAPPTGSGYAERDPTRIRARKFASKPGSSSSSTAPGGPVSSLWTETAEQKLQRLQDAVLGRANPAGEKGPSAAEEARAKEEEERNRTISANISATRGKSLVEQHAQRRKEKGDNTGEEEDDPSKRAFDKEKDMALGGRIGTAQRRELMNKAADFGGRFSKGSFL